MHRKVRNHFIKKIKVTSVSDNVIYFFFSDGTISLHHVNDDFITHDAKSYKCDKEQLLNLTKLDSKNTTGHLHISHVQMQAFANNDKTNFDEGNFFLTIIIIILDNSCIINR